MAHFNDIYRLGGPAGRGRLGELYHAEQIGLRRRTLVRFVARELTSCARAEKELHDQLVWLSVCGGRGIVPILDRGWLGEREYYVLERVEGASLLDLIGSQAVEGALGRIVLEAGETTIIDRVRTVLELLNDLEKLASNGTSLDGLEPSEVLVTAPFRFVLSEPCLAYDVERARRAEASGRPATGAAQVVDLTLRVALDPAWETSERRPARRRAGSVQERLDEIRQAIFAEISSAICDDPRSVVRRSIAVLERTLEETRSSTGNLPRVFSGASRTIRFGRQTVYGAGLTVLLVAAAGSFCYPWLHSAMGVRASGAEELEARVRSATDAASLDAVLADALPSEQRRVAALAERRRTSFRDAQRQDALAEALERLLANDSSQDSMLTLDAEERELVRRVLGTEQPGPTRIAALERILAIGGREELIRCMLLRLVDDEEPDVRRAAAASLAAGYGGASPHLTERLLQYVSRQNRDPDVFLALLHCLAKHADAEVEEVLLQLTLDPRDDRLARNPNRDPWLRQMASFRAGSPNVLDVWIGAPKPYWNEERIRLRVASLFALGMSEAASALPTAYTLVVGADAGLADAAGHFLQKYAEHADPQKLEALYAVAREDRRDRLALALLGAIRTKDEELALRHIRRELEQRDESHWERALLRFVTDEKLISSRDRLRQTLGSVAPGLAENLAHLIRGDEALVNHVAEILRESEPSSELERKAALVAGHLKLTSTRFVEVLEQVVEQPGARDALRALQASESDRALRIVLDVLEDRRRPIRLRMYALFLSGDSLGSARARSQTWRAPIAESDRRAVRILRSMRRMLEADEYPLVFWSAYYLSGYDHPLSLEAMLHLLETARDDGLLQFPIDYLSGLWFTERAASGQMAEEVEAVRSAFLDLLDDRVRVEVKVPILEFFGTLRLSDATEVVAREVMNWADEALELAAITYLARFPVGSKAETALLDMLEWGATPDVSLAALAVLRDHGSSDVAEVVSLVFEESKIPELSFELAHALVDYGRPVEHDKLLDSLRRWLVATETGSTTTGLRTSVGRSVHARIGFSVLREIPGNTMTDALAEWIVDMELEGRSLVVPLGLLILRLTDAERGPEVFEEALAHLGVPFEEFLEQFEAAAIAHLEHSEWLASGSFTQAEVDTILGYLCEEFPLVPSVYRTRARIGRVESDAVYFPDELVEASPPDSPIRKLLDDQARVVQDYESAIKWRDSSARSLRLELAAYLERLGQTARTESIYRAHLREEPDDVSVWLNLVDLLASDGRTEEAFETLATLRASSRVALEPRQYWSRRVSLALRSADNAAIASLGLELFRDPTLAGDTDSLVQTFSPLMGSLFQQRLDHDASLDELVSEVRTVLLHQLHFSFSRSVREEAALHLGWLGGWDSDVAGEVASVLLNVAQGDLAAEVRARAVLGLHHLDAPAARDRAREACDQDDPWLQAVGAWVLLRRDPDEAVLVVGGWLDGRDHARVALALDLVDVWNVGGHDERLHRILREHEAPALRARSATVLAERRLRGLELGVEPLDLAARYDEDPLVRSAATRALSRLGHAGTIERASSIVERALKESRSGVVEMAELADALFALAHDGQEQSFDLLVRLEAMERARLDELLADPIPAAMARNLGDEEWGDIADELAHVGRIDEAREAYQTALSLDPDDWEWIEKLDLISRGLPPVSERRSPSLTGEFGSRVGPLVSWAHVHVLAAVELRRTSAVRPPSLHDRATLLDGTLDGLAAPMRLLPDMFGLGGGVAEALTQRTSQAAHFLADRVLMTRLRSALDLIETYPDFDLDALRGARWFESSLPAPALSYSQRTLLDILSDQNMLGDAFGSRQPRVIEDAASLSGALPLIDALISVGGAPERTADLVVGRSLTSLAAQRHRLREWLRSVSSDD